MKVGWNNRQNAGNVLGCQNTLSDAMYVVALQTHQMKMLRVNCIRNLDDNYIPL